MKLATPSMKMLTRVVSDLPRRSALEISQVPPTEAESTPAQPRAWRESWAQIFLKSFLPEVGELNHGTGSETCSEVGGAGEDETEMVVVHEVVSVVLEDLLDFGGGVGESNKDGLDVVTLLHGDNSHVILLVDPDKEVHGFVVEDTSGVGPVATAS